MIGALIILFLFAILLMVLLGIVVIDEYREGMFDD